MKKSKNLLKDERVVYEENGYTLTEQPDEFDEVGLSLYTVYDKNWEYLGDFEDDKWVDEKTFKSSMAYETFLDIIDGFYYDDDKNWKKWTNDNYWDDDRWYNYTPSALGVYEPKKETPEEKEAREKKEREIIESLCKSDTIVFHKDDPSTVMLKPIYEGRGWDVYTGSSWGSNGLSKEAVHELIQRHDKILGLGHGSPAGLFGGNIGKEEVPLLKEKKVFGLWCYAATFFKDNGFSGQGIFCSDNCPSEVGECKYVCNADVSAEWIYDNMVKLGEILGSVIDLAFTNPQEACRIAKEKYSKTEATTEDEKKVVEFNTNTLQVV